MEKITKLEQLKTPCFKSKRIIKEAYLPKRKVSKSIKLVMKGKKTIKVSPSYSRRLSFNCKLAKMV